MEQYFAAVVETLSIEDSTILGILHDDDANSKVKAIKVNDLWQKSGLSEAKFRKVMDRLTALRFIVFVKDYKEHSIFISDYGVEALESILKTMER